MKKSKRKKQQQFVARSSREISQEFMVRYAVYASIRWDARWEAPYICERRELSQKVNWLKEGF